MPWAFIPVLVFIGMAPVPGIAWGPFVALAISAWLGARHGRLGVVAVAVAWTAMSIRISVGGSTFGLRWDYGLAAVLLAHVSAHPSPTHMLRQAAERAMRSRLTWLVAGALPVVIHVPLVADQQRTYVGFLIGFSLLVALLPMLAASSNAPRVVYGPIVLFAVLSLTGRALELGLPQRPWATGPGQATPQLWALYGGLGIDRVIVALALGLAGHAIWCLASAKEVHRLLLLPALLIVALGPYEAGWVAAPRAWLAVVESSSFIAAGALLAGVAAGTLGFALATLVSTASVALLLGWIHTEAPWLHALMHADGAVFRVNVSPIKVIYLPVLAALFGIAGTEVRAAVLARRPAPSPQPEDPTTCTGMLR
jgi:hypothetical protein